MARPRHASAPPGSESRRKFSEIFGKLRKDFYFPDFEASSCEFNGLRASGSFLGPRGARAPGALEGAPQRQRRNKDEWRRQRTGVADREDRPGGRSSVVKARAAWELRNDRPLSNSGRDSRPAAALAPPRIVHNSECIQKAGTCPEEFLNISMIGGGDRGQQAAPAASVDPRRRADGRAGRARTPDDPPSRPTAARGVPPALADRRSNPRPFRDLAAHETNHRNRQLSRWP